jgi:L-aspartate oxidase
MTYRTPQETAKCDVLIIGSGIAGLMLCHGLAGTKLKVLLACKGKLIDSNTSYAQGGLAAVTPSNPEDSLESHLRDTLSSGAGLTDPHATQVILENGNKLVEKLYSLGVGFDRKDGSFDTALEGGHSFARVLHSKDASGRAISTALIAGLTQASNVTIWEDACASDLIVSDGRCIGAKFIDEPQAEERRLPACVGAEQSGLSPAATIVPVFARHVVLATGGIGRVFARTTNPAVATGDGVAMAYRAGARLVDLEFVQFHPTALSVPNAPASLISEAIRGAGGILLDKNGERFAFRFDKRGELATRDIVARAIYTTMMEQESPSVWLDMRPIGVEKISNKFPNIIAECRKWGVDPATQPIPIAPAAHYFMGGIWADAYGRTSLPGLFAIGECASTGLHGANRLASNSLLEGGVMALLVAELLQGEGHKPLRMSNYRVGPNISVPPYATLADVEAFRDAMFKNVGLERSREGLERIINRISETIVDQKPSTRATAEAANITLLGWLIARAAYERRESRGAHWRADYAAINDREFLRRFTISKSGTGWLDIAPMPTVQVIAQNINRAVAG